MHLQRARCKSTESAQVRLITDAQVLEAWEQGIKLVRHASHQGAGSRLEGVCLTLPKATAAASVGRLLRGEGTWRKMGQDDNGVPIAEHKEACSRTTTSKSVYIDYMSEFPFGDVWAAPLEHVLQSETRPAACLRSTRST